MRVLSAALLAVVACAHVERHPTDVERRLAALEARTDWRAMPQEEFYRALRVPSGIFYASAPMSRINPPSFLLGQGAAIGEGGNCAEPSAACRAASFTATGAITGTQLILTAIGTLTNTAIQESGDPNNGINFPAADNIDFVTNGALRLEITNSGLFLPGAADSFDFGSGTSRWRNAFFNTFQPVGITTASGNSFFLVASNAPAISVNGTETVRFAATRGAAGSVYLSGGAGAVDTWGTVDQTFCVYNTGALAGATAFGQTKFIHSATVDVSSFIAQDVAGTGAGNFVVKVCTDGATCAGGNTFLTYTEACTAAAGVITAATVQNSGAIPANSTVTVSVATACGPDPAANVCIHYTTP